MTSTFVRAEARAPRAERVFDNRVRNTGRRYVYEWQDPDAAPHCLVYGDSFALRVLAFLAESFARLTFVHTVNLDLDLVRTLDPDAVVKIMNERFLIRVPWTQPPRHTRRSRRRRSRPAKWRPKAPAAEPQAVRR